MGPKRREWGREREQSTPAPDRPERTEASTSRAPSSSLQSWERPQKDSPIQQKAQPSGLDGLVQVHRRALLPGGHAPVDMLPAVSGLVLPAAPEHGVVLHPPLTAGGAVPLGAEKEGEVHLHRPGIDGDGGDLPGGEGLFPLDQPEAVPGAGHQSVDPVQSPPLGSPGALNLDGLPAPHKGEGLAQGRGPGRPLPDPGRAADRTQRHRRG